MTKVWGGILYGLAVRGSDFTILLPLQTGHPLSKTIIVVTQNKLQWNDFAFCSCALRHILKSGELVFIFLLIYFL